MVMARSRLFRHTSVLLVLSLLVLTAGRTNAQTFPSNKITLIVAFAAGGVADTLARMVGQGLSDRVHQNVVVENRGGAGGNIAAGVVAHAPADGYTLLVTTTALAINETLRETKPFSAADFKTVAIVASSPEALVTSPSNPAKNLAEFVKAAQGKTINFGSAGVGSGSHIEAEYFFKKIAKIDATHVHSRAAPRRSTQRSETRSTCLQRRSAAAPPRRLRAVSSKGLGVASEKRASVTPDVPTFAESGFPASLPRPGSASSPRPKPTRRSLRRSTPRSTTPSRIRMSVRNFRISASTPLKDRPRRPRPCSRPKSASGAIWSRR